MCVGMTVSLGDTNINVQRDASEKCLAFLEARLQRYKIEIQGGTAAGHDRGQAWPRTEGVFLMSSLALLDLLAGYNATAIFRPNNGQYKNVTHRFDCIFDLMR